MRINVSQILAYERCPTYWIGRYVACRGPEQKSKALRFGNRYHDLCEFDRWKADPLDTPLEKKQLLYGFALWRRARESWGIRVIDTEVSMEMQVGEHTVFGQIDAVVEWNGRTWMLQHKTINETANIPQYVRSLERSWHEITYGLLAQANGYDDYAGSIIVCMRKIALVRRASWKANMLQIEPVRIRPDALFRFHLKNRLERMSMYYTPDPLAAAQRMDGGGISQNRSNCLKYNRLCDYVDVCDGEASVLDMPTCNSLERYAK